MLRGISANEIIVGAYADGGGICPMLAAHRAGSRTSQISFARAWDRFAFRGARIRMARRATQRELLILKTHLEASLLAEEDPALDFGEAVAEHRALVARQSHVEPPPAPEGAATRPGDPDRTSELRRQPGWAWLRVMRRYDDYERALARLDDEHDALRDLELV
jgi:hypothetical protein